MADEAQKGQLGEDLDQADKRQDEEDAKEDAAPIKFTPLGSEQCPVDPEADSIEYSMLFRIPKIENLEKCTKMTFLGLRKNLIKKLEGLD